MILFNEFIVSHIAADIFFNRWKGISLKFVLIDIPFRLVQMKALLAACKPLLLLDLHRS